MFYFVIRGGLLIPTIQVQQSPSPSDPHLATLHANPYSLAAFSALAGMFSKQATDKLAAVFDTVFAMKKPVERQAALGSSRSLKIVPPTLTSGKSQTLTVTGSGFQTDTKATINGKDRAFKALSATQGEVIVLDEDVKAAGKLDFIITNPNKDTFNGTVDVVEPGAAEPPQQ